MAMLDAPLIELPSPPAATYMLRDMPVPRRFPMMRDMMADGHKPFMVSVLSATREDPEAPFDGGFEYRATGELSCLDLYTDAVTYTRTERGVASSPTDQYGLQLQVEGVSHFAQGGQTRTHAPGSLMLMDSNVPFHTVKPGRSRHRKILIPRRQIDALITPGWQRESIHFAQPGLGGLLTQYARVLMEEMGRLNAAEAGVALDNLCRLLALYANARTPHADPADGAMHAARLVQVRRHIDQHLADPGLTPASVAAAHRMSQRSLHLLFEPTGISFARHVLRRRLQECHAMLASPAHAYRSVTDIAFAWGFSSLTTFYGAFQRQFGIAPGELRRTAGSRDAASPDRAIRAH
jgi:AraC family transcriptional regulator, positive regulator of tynA and feaB